MSKFVLILLAFFATAHTYPLNKSSSVPFIIGGEEIKIVHVPHQISLQNSYGRHICGGSVISKDAVLTAAHCVVGEETLFWVNAGSSYHNDGSWTSEHRARRVIIHPRYTRRPPDYDFAIVKITPPFTLGYANIAVIKIADEEPPDNTELYVTGWGKTEDGYPNYLMGVTVTTINRESCYQMYSPRGLRISERMICAADTYKDACQGDSGGPLIDYRNKILYGVVSWGLGCADQRYPGVYANVAHQKDWIKQHICN